LIAKEYLPDDRIRSYWENEKGDGVIFNPKDCHASRVKKCPGCNNWLSINDILWDPDILPVGMHVESENCELHGFLFQHDNHTCRSSFHVHLKALDFLIRPLSGEPTCKNPTDCDHRCHNTAVAEPCRLECRFAPYHNLMMQMVESRDAGQSVVLSEDYLAKAG
jgi:hypothetical protein